MYRTTIYKAGARAQGTKVHRAPEPMMSVMIMTMMIMIVMITLMRMRATIMMSMLIHAQCVE